MTAPAGHDPSAGSKATSIEVAIRVLRVVTGDQTHQVAIARDLRSGQPVRLVSEGSAIRPGQVGLARCESRAVTGYGDVLHIRSIAPLPAELKAALPGLGNPEKGERDRGLPIDTLPIGESALTDYLVDTLPGQSRDQVAKALRAVGAAGLLEALDHWPPPKIADLFGLGVTAGRLLVENWLERAPTHRALIGLRSIGLTASQAQRALQAAQHRASDPIDAALRICRFPYRLTLLSGLSFSSADEVALAMGIPRHAPERIRAGARFALGEAALKEGHTALSIGVLSRLTQEVLDSKSPRSSQDGAALTPQAIGQQIALSDEDDGLFFPGGRDRNDASPVALPALMLAEVEVARNCARIFAGRAGAPLVLPSRDVVEAALTHSVEDLQYTAVVQGARYPISVLTGRPGCGKTMIVRSMCSWFASQGESVGLAAPFGRAAKNLATATGLPATTVARMLGARGLHGEYRFNLRNPLPFKNIIVDEFGTLGASGAAHLVRAVASGSRLILVGDMEQLPSIEAGSVLADLILSRKIPAVRLTQVRRRASDNPINFFANEICEGRLSLPDDGKGLLNVEDIRSDDRLLAAVLARVTEIYDREATMEETAVLVPMHHGLLGTINLNRRIQQAINPGAQKGLKIGTAPDGSDFFVVPGDRIMQTSNDKQLLLANGEVGKVTYIDARRRLLRADFGQGEIEIPRSSLYRLTLAYGMTIHKSQGGQYRNVILPLSKRHQSMLRRNLVYTAVTRSSERLWVMGDPQVLSHGISNASDNQRRTLLASLLRVEFQRFEERHSPLHEPLHLASCEADYLNALELSA